MLINKKLSGHLECSFLSYNCGTKMVGRLRLVTDGTTDTVYVDGNDHESVMKKKKELIHELVRWMTDKANFPTLSMKEPGYLYDGKPGPNPLWPHDNGIYQASCFIYADAMDKKGYFYSDFGSLIRDEFMVDRSYGVQVVKGPLYLNNTYQGSARFSRTWHLFFDNPTHGALALVTRDNLPVLRSKNWGLDRVNEAYLRQHKYREDEITEILKEIA